VTWNVERGKRFEPLLGLLQGHPELVGADLLLLTELDIGMGRSGNRHIPRELGRALGLDWVFANFHLVLAPGDSAERDHGVPNTQGLHGAALLSRFPIRRFAAVSLPERANTYDLGTSVGLFVNVGTSWPATDSTARCGTT
jgi:endonuclease/exonuclease/phosphatase family metal-dependent hydrolase